MSTLRPVGPIAAENPEKYVDQVQLHFVESTAKSIYDVESDLTDAITGRVLENLPLAINTLIVGNDSTAITAVFQEFFAIDEIRSRTQSFFEDFATADAFLELRDMQHTLRSAENQSFYLYLCEIRFGPHAFPLFYIPANLEYDDEGRSFLIDVDPHLFVNKQAIDWILQERAGEATKVPISPVKDRILYLDGQKSYVDEMEGVLSRLIPSLELTAHLDLRSITLQQQSATTFKLSNTAYFAVFDKSDEALLGWRRRLEASGQT